MKLTDFTLPTEASRAATAKLGKQVHKATVAAAKAPRLELGVVGISIGQTQSTGDTSKTALPWTNKSLNESISSSEAVDLLHEFEHASGIKMRIMHDVKTVAFTEEDVIDEALRIYRTHKQDEDAPRQFMNKYVRELRTQLNSTVTIFEKVAQIGKFIDATEHKTPAFIAESIEAGRTLHKNQASILAYVTALERAIEYLHFLNVEAPKSAQKTVSQFADATAIHLGLR